jgi:hypothetical protein
MPFQRRGMNAPAKGRFLALLHLGNRGVFGVSGGSTADGPTARAEGVGQSSSR